MEQMKYVKNECVFEEGLWRLKDSAPFEYNDGDKEEEYILSAITNAENVSSTSIELESYIKNWPSKYHLSIERSFAYRSLLIAADMKVLEIGSGCGAITTYLGETGAEVLALEGSPRRARITRERTRGLENVSVLAAPFDLVNFASFFDLVICNGVLEYAPLFLNTKNPFEDFLKRCGNILSASGALVVAIENQFGLRYFSSGKEEHTNVLYDGLHGYPAKHTSAMTFSRKVLRDLIENKIGQPDILLPIPDYKLPRALIKEDLASYVNFGELVADLQSYDFGSVIKPILHERLVYHELGKSNLINELSNSFFMVAGPGKKNLFREGWLGSIYKDPRLGGPIRRNDIYLDSELHVRLASCRNFTFTSQRILNIPENEQFGEPWIHGVSVHTLVSMAFCRKKNTSLRVELKEPLNAWWQSVTFVKGSVGAFIAQNNIDAIWRNAKKEGKDVRLFDQEWISEVSVPSNWLIYRAVSEFYATEFFYFHNWNWVYRWYPPIVIMIIVGRIVGLDFRIKDLWVGINHEVQFQKKVSGRELNRFRLLLLAFSPLYLKELKCITRDFFKKIGYRALAVFKSIR
jgi:SAM-dependent methyltransferase